MWCRLLFNLGLTIKASGESLLHTFRTSQRTPWVSLYLFNYSRNLVPLGVYEPILLKKCDARCYLIAAQKFRHLANPCFTCKYTFCTSQRTPWVSLCLVVYCKSSWRMHSTDAIRGLGKLPCSVPCTEHLFCFINTWRYINRGNTTRKLICHFQKWGEPASLP